MKIAVFFVGEVEDAGFNASALAGAQAASAEGLADISIVSGVSYDQPEIRNRMAAILPDHDGLVFIGGQGNLATPELARAYPDKRFAIVQGNQTGPNLASYDVRQEDSAFLAGCLAARLTQSGTVAHLSGHRVPPGLKGRAAFAAGVAHADPSVGVLTGFCGTQDDGDVTYRWASAQIAAGADILFTMLNGARGGAIRACRENGTRQIGNALDWVARDPAVFVASAIARIDTGVRHAIRDMVDGQVPDHVVEFGLAEGDFISLSLGREVPQAVSDEIEDFAEGIRTGRIVVPKEYTGDEFNPDEVPCDATQ
ncbi:BMP family ABC transporter substrate-binding protein [Dinoroseobacter sp. S124A]|uniref:BMP family ABC transporter substrate-binding protein n=1 Tax=Dinoroseobacter sp. S124A TaxID=3415128 RepID=UPI003C79B6B0